MPMTKRAVQTAMEKRMSTQTLHIILQFVKDKTLHSGGSIWSKTFVKDSILVALYKDLFAVGYTSLFNQVKDYL